MIIMIPNIMRGYASKNRKNYGEALEKFNAVQQSLLSGAETVKVCLYRSNAKRMIENKNNEIEKEEKRLRNCQVSVYGLAGGMQILKRFLILAVGVYLIYRNIIKVGGLLVAVQLAEVLAAPAETLAYLLNAKNEARPLVEKYEQLAETEEDRGKIDINDIEDICVEHLSYGRNGVKIIKDVSFAFEKGRKYMLTGSSGSGKSTLLHMLGGLDRPTEGKVFVDGKDIFALKDEELTIFRRRKIGFVFQAYNLVPVLNVYENIVLPIELDGGKIDRKFIDSITETLGLQQRLDALPGQLSGGQQQRVAIARALAAAPAIILADEPTGNLDGKTSQDVLSLLKVTSRKFAQTIVMITHNEEIAQLADRIIRIEDGRIIK